MKLFNHQININKYKKTETLVLKNGHTNPIPKKLPIGLENIKRIIFRHCNFTELPDNLPNNLEKLYFEYNKNLKTLPNNLPTELKKLYCVCNQELDISINLPNNLKELYYMFNCTKNNINKHKKLHDILPKDLEILICKGNMIKKLPDDLPKNLKKLDCSINLIKELPKLPTSLEELYCDFNYGLISLDIPDNLKKIQIDKNQFDRFKKLLLIHISNKNNKNNKNNKLHEIIIHYTEWKWEFTPQKIINIKKEISDLNQEFKEIDENVNISLIGPISENDKNNKKVGGKKNNNNVTIKKSELQKIASKNNISLKKRDGTIKKKMELYKLLKIKKLI